MKIQNFTIDTSDMPAAVTTRKFTVVGEKGAEFILYVLQDDTLKYYNFDDSTFALGHNSKNNNLEVVLKGGNYNGQITFPSGAGTYTIKLIVSKGTEIQGTSKTVISTSIDKLAADATVTFSPGTTNSSNYETLPTTTSSGAPSASSTFSFDWNIVNKSSDSHGFGLRLPVTTTYQRIGDNYWYFTVTDTVNGAISSGTQVVVDDTTDISVGMVITSVSSGSLSGTPSILSVDTATKTLTISSAQTFADGITLTFKAIGSEAIKTAIGLEVEFVQYPIVTPTILTKTIRAGSSGTTINLNGTYGITGGNHATVLGVGINNATDNAITSVSASSSAGSIVVQTSQSSDLLVVGGVLTFRDTHQTINVIGSIKITKYPTANRTIYLDIDKFITVGTAS